MNEKVMSKLFVVLESGKRQTTSYKMYGCNDLFASLTTKQLDLLDVDGSQHHTHTTMSPHDRIDFRVAFTHFRDDKHFCVFQVANFLIETHVSETQFHLKTRTSYSISPMIQISLLRLT